MKESRRYISTSATHRCLLSLFYMEFYDQRCLEIYSSGVDRNIKTGREKEYLFPINKYEVAEKGHSISVIMVA